MNTLPFTSEVDSSPSDRRASDRLRALKLVDKSFFTKTYKPKGQLVSCNKDNKNKEGVLEPDPQRPTIFQSATALFFATIKADRRQSKAIQTFRAKKLKRLFSKEESLIKAIHMVEVRCSNGPSTLQLLKRPMPNGKSIFAAVRARDAKGRFNNTTQLSKKQSGEFSTVDLREDCRTETVTTADGSYHSLLHFTSHNGSKYIQGPFFEFESAISESDSGQRAAIHPLKPILLPQLVPQIPQKKSSVLVINVEQDVRLSKEENAGYIEEEPFWEMERGFDEMASYTHLLQCTVFRDRQDEDQLEDLIVSE